MGKWVDVVARRSGMRFPNCCANCFHAAPTAYLALKSDERKLKAFYVVASKHEQLWVKIPYCERCAARQMRWGRIGERLMWVGLAVGVAIGVLLNLGGLATGILGAALCLPAYELSRYRDWVVRVRRYDKTTATLSFKHAAYADEFARLNQVLAQ